MPKRKERITPSTSDIFEFKITLKRIKPNIWRRFAVTEEYTLADLHDVIQVVMGWGDSHLHQFIINGKYYIPYEDELDLDGENESAFRLNQLFEGPGAKFEYEYDFGDGWEHELKLMKIYPAKPKTIYPVCLDGKRNCPPEDCGGPWGYANLHDIISNPDHPEHEEMREWLGEYYDFEEFDLEFINESMQKQARDPNVIQFPGLGKKKK
jgi:hypothetical protein